MRAAETPPETAGLLEILDRHRVRFVVVGSAAAAAHGVPGVEPADLDVVPAADPSNLRRLAAVLEALDASASVETGAWRSDQDGEHRWVEDRIERPPRPLDPGDPSTFDHSFTTRLGRLDVIPAIAGSYDQLQPRATLLEIAGRPAWIADPVDVMAGMTAPRRPKDRARVRHLREVAVRASGVGFIGFRTDRFEEMVTLFRDRIGLATIREADGAHWFRLGTDAELHVYADTDPDHGFFTTGPVVGLRVEDVDVTRAALQADGLEMITEIERTDAAAWCHFRAPDGTVLEIIGPAR